MKFNVSLHEKKKKKKGGPLFEKQGKRLAPIFTWYDDWQTIYGHSDPGTWQTFSRHWTKWTCHFMENSREYLLPVTNSRLQEKNYNFRSLTSATMNLMGSQHLNNSFLSWWWTREAWRAAVHGVAKSRTRLSDWTEPNWATSVAVLISVRFLSLLLLSFFIFCLPRSYIGKKKTSRLQLRPWEGTHKKLGRNSVFQHV